MRVATETPDAPRSATLFAEIPLAMTAHDLQHVFEQPLEKWLAEQAADFSLRCFPMPARDDRPTAIGIEIQTDEFAVLALAVEKIAELGAPPETRIEIESEKATIQTTLAEGGE